MISARTLSTIPALLLLVSVSSAQVQPNRSSTYHLITDTGKILDIREKLVSLALQNPTFEIADHNLAIAEYNIRIAKGSWLNTISAQGNLNEYAINPPKASSNGSTTVNFATTYPRYNFGITIPFDIFTKIPNNIKIARENYLIAMAQKNDKFREIKALVLTKYEDYLLTKQKLELQTQITQDEFALYKKAEKDFDDNVIKLEDFNKSAAAWVASQIVKLDYQRNLNVAKIELEKMIGIKLEEVMQQR